MKITTEIECTPEEARKFLGIPDNSQLLESIKPTSESMEKVMSSVPKFDPFWFWKLDNQKKD